jgi:hypothetical protein
MSANNRNRLKTTVSAVASSGLGAFTISTASSGYRSFVAGDDGLTFDGVLITEGTAWEVRDGCVYTHSGTSLSRGTLMDSSTGSAIAFTSAAVVSQGGTAGFANNLHSLRVSGFSARADGTNTQNLTTGTGTTLISGSGGALRSVDWNINSYFDTTSGIFFPQEQGLWLIGGTGVIDSMNDGKYMAVYLSHSTDGSTWSDNGAKGCLAWRGASSAASLVIGGSGSFIVESNGTTDRWALRIFHNDAGTPKIPGTAANIAWCRFWAKRIGSIS